MLMVIVQIKYVKNSTNYLKKTDIFINWMQSKNCKLSRYYSRLEHWHLKTYHKPNNETLDIQAKSSHPANILKHLYQSKLNYLAFPEILKFFIKHLNTIQVY